MVDHLKFESLFQKRRGRIRVIRRLIRGWGRDIRPTSTAWVVDLEVGEGQWRHTGTKNPTFRKGNKYKGKYKLIVGKKVQKWNEWKALM